MLIEGTRVRSPRKQTPGALKNQTVDLFCVLAQRVSIRAFQTYAITIPGAQCCAIRAGVDRQFDDGLGLWLPALVGLEYELQLAYFLINDKAQLKSVL